MKKKGPSSGTRVEWEETRRNENTMIPEDVSFKVWHLLTWWISTTTNNWTEQPPSRSGLQPVRSLSLSLSPFYPPALLNSFTLTTETKVLPKLYCHLPNYTASRPWRTSPSHSRPGEPKPHIALSIFVELKMLLPFQKYACLKHVTGPCVISGFRREGAENCALLGYYAASSGSFLPTFRDKLSVPSSGLSETSVRNNHYPPRNNPEERGSHVTGQLAKTHDQTTFQQMEETIGKNCMSTVAAMPQLCRIF
jgi:hypothetical protein